MLPLGVHHVPRRQEQDPDGKPHPSLRRLNIRSMLMMKYQVSPAVFERRNVSLRSCFKARRGRGFELTDRR